VKDTRFALDHFDLFVRPFDFAGMNGVITVVENAVSIPIQSLSEAGYRGVF
jgi:hypothetical protein